MILLIIRRSLSTERNNAPSNQAAYPPRSTGPRESSVGSNASNSLFEDSAYESVAAQLAGDRDRRLNNNQAPTSSRESRSRSLQRELGSGQHHNYFRLVLKVFSVFPKN